MGRGTSNANASSDFVKILNTRGKYAGNKPAMLVTPLALAHAPHYGLRSGAMLVQGSTTCSALLTTEGAATTYGAEATQRRAGWEYIIPAGSSETTRVHP